MRHLQTYPHGRVQRPGNLIILFEPGAASQDLGQPESSDGTLHVANLALSGSGSLDPLRGLSANTTNHVGMGERLGASGALLDVQGRGERLGDSRVERRSPAGDDEAMVGIVSGWGTLAGAGARAQAQRGSHCEKVKLGPIELGVGQ